MRQMTVPVDSAGKVVRIWVCAVVLAVGALVAQTVPAQASVQHVLTGRSPANVAISPDGTFGYVANYRDSFLTHFWPAGNATLEPIPITGGAYDVDISPDGSFAYTTGHSGLQRIRSSDRTVTAMIPSTGQFAPGAIAFSRDGSFAYVASNVLFGPSALMRVSTSDNSMRTVIDYGTDAGVRDIKVSPDGANTYILARTSDGTPMVQRLRTSDGAVTGTTYIRPEPGSRAFPERIAISPDGSTALATLSIGLAGAVVRIRTQDLTETARYGAGASPRDVLFAPNGLHAYVSDMVNGAVHKIRMSDGATVASIPTEGMSPDGMALMRSGASLYVANNGSDNVAVIPTATPGAPQSVTAKPGNASAAVSWSAPADPGDTSITGYTVVASPGGAQCQTPAGASPVPTSCVVQGLNNGTAYTFTVTARNAAGQGTTSTATAAVTPTAPKSLPTAPTNVKGTPGVNQIAVTWTAPVSDGGQALTRYQVLAYQGATLAKTCFPAPLTGTSCVLAGLTNGVAYSVQVRAANTSGYGAKSAPLTATPAASLAPAPPSAVTATPGPAKAKVSWSPPTGGAAITGYTVTASPGGATCATPVGATPVPMSCEVKGLTNGTAYTFTATARSAAGASAPSAPSAAVVPFTFPGAPASVAVTPGAGQLTITWAAPASNGGRPINRYQALIYQGSTLVKTCFPSPLTGATCTAAGLTNGTVYSVQVRAANDAGYGTRSARLDVTPRTVPGAPTAATAVAGNASATVSWTPPGNTGGSPITAYRVTASPGGATCATPANASPMPASCVVSGLANGTAYTFTVAASNAAGTGPVSAPTAAVTPAAPAVGVTCTGTGCDRKDPIETGCAKDARTVASAPIRDEIWNRDIGTVELRWSPTCQTNWSRATVNFYSENLANWAVGVVRQRDEYHVEHDLVARLQPGGVNYSDMIYAPTDAVYAWTQLAWIDPGMMEKHLPGAVTKAV